MGWGGGHGLSKQPPPTLLGATETTCSFSCECVYRSTDERHIILSIRSWQGKSQGHENNISISNGMLCTGGCSIGKQGLMEYPSIDTIR